MRALHEFPGRFGKCRILVVGDVMLDEYFWGHIERISPEAPVPILKIERRESTLGGTGNVVKNLRALGVGVTIISVVGDDETGRRIETQLGRAGADTRGVIRESERCSTKKSRLMSMEHGQQVFRVDEECNEPVSGQTEERITQLIAEAGGENDLILCSDYMKGVLTEKVLQSAFAMGRKTGKPTVVGPKDGNARKYAGTDILVPNFREFSQLAGSPPNGRGWLTDSAQFLTQLLGLQALVVTRGKEGMSVFEKKSGKLCSVDIPTAARSVYDVTGAGDTVLSVFSAAIACGAGCGAAARLANCAAGIVVGKAGTATVTVEEMQEFFEQHESASYGVGAGALSS